MINSQTRSLLTMAQWQAAVQDRLALSPEQPARFTADLWEAYLMPHCDDGAT